MSSLNGADQRVKGRVISGDVAGFDLNDQAGGFKAKGAAPGDDVDALVRTGRRDIYHITLRLENFGNEAREIMAREGARNAPLDLIPRDLVKIDLGAISGEAVR